MPLVYGGDMVPERLLLAGILLASGCNSSPPVPTAASSAPSAAPAPSNEDTALATARAAAGKLGTSVKTRLVDAMNAGGRAQRRRGLLRRPLGGGAGRPLSCLSATAALGRTGPSSRERQAAPSRRRSSSSSRSSAASRAEGVPPGGSSGPSSRARRRQRPSTEMSNAALATKTTPPITGTATLAMPPRGAARILSPCRRTRSSSMASTDSPAQRRS
jgi:hypothetical protein